MGWMLHQYVLAVSVNTSGGDSQQGSEKLHEQFLAAIDRVCAEYDCPDLMVTFSG